MKFSFDENPSAITIASYAPGWIRVGDTRVETPCVVTPERIDLELLPPKPADLEAAHFSRLLEFSPEIILLGTGPRQLFVDYAYTRMLAAEQVGLEVMDTGAACRSFNILTGEGRAVLAALYMI